MLLLLAIVAPVAVLAAVSALVDWLDVDDVFKVVVLAAVALGVAVAGVFTLARVGFFPALYAAVADVWRVAVSLLPYGGGR